jgi:hypothetical protein
MPSYVKFKMINLESRKILLYKTKIIKFLKNQTFLDKHLTIKIFQLNKNIFNFIY